MREIVISNSLFYVGKFFVKYGLRSGDVKCSMNKVFFNSYFILLLCIVTTIYIYMRKQNQQ